MANDKSKYEVAKEAVENMAAYAVASKLAATIRGSNLPRDIDKMFHDYLESVPLVIESLELMGDKEIEIEGGNKNEG